MVLGIGTQDLLDKGPEFWAGRVKSHSQPGTHFLDYRTKVLTFLLAVVQDCFQILEVILRSLSDGSFPLWDNCKSCALILTSVFATS